MNFSTSLRASSGKERWAMDGTGAPLCADVGESRKLPHTTSSDEISPLADSVIHRNVNLPCSIPQCCQVLAHERDFISLQMRSLTLSKRHF